MDPRAPYRPNLIIDGYFVLRCAFNFLSHLIAWPLVEKRLPTREQVVDIYRWHYAITFLLLAIPRVTGDPEDLGPLIGLLERQHHLMESDLPDHWRGQAQARLEAEAERFSASLQAKALANEARRRASAAGEREGRR